MESIIAIVLIKMSLGLDLIELFIHKFSAVTGLIQGLSPAN